MNHPKTYAIGTRVKWNGLYHTIIGYGDDALGGYIIRRSDGKGLWWLSESEIFPVTLTPETAISDTRTLWTELARTGEDREAKFVVVKRLFAKGKLISKEYLHACPLCQMYRAENCVDCPWPGQGKVRCEDRTNPASIYGKWRHASSIDECKALASTIASLPFDNSNPNKATSFTKGPIRVGDFIEAKNAMEGTFQGEVILVGQAVDGVSDPNRLVIRRNDSKGWGWDDKKYGSRLWNVNFSDITSHTPRILAVGDAVRAIAASHGWGDVSMGDIGTITRIDTSDSTYAVRFPSEDRWWASRDDLEYISPSLLPNEKTIPSTPPIGSVIKGVPSGDLYLRVRFDAAHEENEIVLIHLSSMIVSKCGSSIIEALSDPDLPGDTSFTIPLEQPFFACVRKDNQ